MNNHTTHIGAVKLVSVVTVLAHLSIAPSAAEPLPISMTFHNLQSHPNTLHFVACTAAQITDCKNTGQGLACPQYNYDTLVERQRCLDKYMAECLRSCGS